MKIGIFSVDSLSAGKANIVDKRVDTLQGMFKSPKKVYVQVELLTDKEALKESDGILCLEDAKLDLIVSDLDFVEARLSRSEDEAEKALFLRFKEKLDKELLLSEAALSAEEKKMIAGYPLLTVKPVHFAQAEEFNNKDEILSKVYSHFGYISFFTAGEKDAHAWSLKKGATAWEAAGCIHSDIQRGFIRAEVVAFRDLTADGGLAQARSNNHVRLENKEYLVQDGDYIVFRFNK